MNTYDPSETITCSPTDNTHYGINYYPCGHIHLILTISIIRDYYNMPK